MQIFVSFYSLSGNLLTGFYCMALYDLFRCLVTLMIRGKSVGRNNRLLEREKQSHINLF